MRKNSGVMALAIAGALAFGGTYAKATDFGIPALKLIVIDKLAAASKGKAVFVAKDAVITKGPGTDVNDISATLDVTYDGGDGAISGAFVIPAGESDGTTGWLVNKPTVAKFVNKASPGGSTVTKVSVIKPGILVKLVAKERGDTPLDIFSVPDSVAGVAQVAYCFDNGGDVNCFCSQFNACAYNLIAGDTGAKLTCKGGVADGTCGAAVPPVPLRFTTAAAGGTCGETRQGGSGGTIIKSLTCGGLNVGGGCFQSGGSCGVPEGPTPSGADTFFNAACSGGSCTISARTAAQTGSSNNCSDTGCKFGPPLSIANGGTSTCVLNTFSAPASGTMTTPGGDFTGGVPLTSTVTLTGNNANPCPSCSGAPGAGTCDATASNPGAACTGINAAGDAYECLPAGIGLTPFGVNLTPISTNTETKSGPGGVFCPGQDGTEPGSFGCFDSGPTTVCDYIEARGTDAAGITDGGSAVSGRLASIFCIPATLNGLIDGAADLPGPGEVTLPGTFELN